jgi:hypothetical protein
MAMAHPASIGGIHGGYEWNTILLAYELIDFFEVNSDFISAQLTVYIIPSANPDGQVRIVGYAGRFSAQDIKGDTFEGRFNGNGVTESIGTVTGVRRLLAIPN